MKFIYPKLHKENMKEKKKIKEKKMMRVLNSNEVQLRYTYDT